MNDTRHSFRLFFAVILSLLFAYALAMLSLPLWAAWLRPAWVTLVVIYWVLAMPEYFGLGKAWLAGLIYDFLQGSLLGEHALILLLISFVVIKLRDNLQTLSKSQKVLFIFILVLVQQALIMLLEKLLGRMPSTWQFWLPALTSAIVWPVVSTFLQAYQRYFRIKTDTSPRFHYDY